MATRSCLLRVWRQKRPKKIFRISAFIFTITVFLWDKKCKGPVNFREIGFVSSSNGPTKHKLQGAALGSFLKSFVSNKKSSLESKGDRKGASSPTSAHNASVLTSSGQVGIASEDKVLTSRSVIRSEIYHKRRTKRNRTVGIDEFAGAPVYGKGGTITQYAKSYADDQSVLMSPLRVM
mmetsp:Transcript_17219/g.25831  ORF Transcript_17219/g.25831 Transcript_17219/m.25831 type:complete len:178 (-) Transcript_17219:260-793(-)